MELDQSSMDLVSMDLAVSTQVKYGLGPYAADGFVRGSSSGGV